ncbi:uncharacterized protein J7T55_015455 [Diaporthe amygdali]|uniref:uncharacterized protein n=1 Tax=Phomopsis amygdali TaxID=1214568 RepID=UPI0022FE51EA|nr:uncharacterized protein J7T55_015455 [Diaporthe amygdali]KAJ0120723.1 uncharacterized protein J7T55_015455 [Diaporthe amygdali]
METVKSCNSWKRQLSVGVSVIYAVDTRRGASEVNSPPSKTGTDGGKGLDGRRAEEDHHVAATLKTVALVDDPSHEMIIVNPFKNVRLKHLGDAMESWAQNASKRLQTRFNIRAYSFDVYEVFESGPKRLQTLIAHLQNKVNELDWDEESPLHYRRSEIKVQRSSKSAMASRDVKGKKSPKIVFVAHSLGAWVVKGLSPSLSGAACLVILDARASSANGDYMQYLFKLTELFAVQSIKPARLEELRRFLQETDNTFNDKELGVQNLATGDQTKSPFQFRIRHESIWISGDVSSPASPSKKPRRLSKTINIGSSLRGIIPGGPNPGTTPGLLAVQLFNSVNLESMLNSLISDDLGLKRERTEELATSFFRTGEFHNAQRLFSILDNQGSNLAQGQMINVRLSLAQTFLYTGEYLEARRRLQDLNDQVLRNKFGHLKSHIKLEIDRWLAVSSIFLGDYNDAAERLRRLLDQFDDTRNSGPEANDFYIAVRRDLALTYAHLGQYLQAETLLNRVDEDIANYRPSDDIDVKITALSVSFVRATLFMFWGEMSDALRESEKVRRGLQEQLGRYHFQTLESASLQIRILTYMSRYDEAQPQCDALIGDMSRELGRNHPLTLGAVEILVHILRSQSRFAEALETARSLHNRTESCLGAEHPQTLRTRSHLAATHFELGNYRTAEKEIEVVLSIGDKRSSLGKTRPDVLEYHCVKARILNRTERSEKALQLALDTLEKQMVLYEKVTARPKSASSKIGRLDGLVSRPPTLTFKINDKHSNPVEAIESTLNDMERDTKGRNRNFPMISTLELLALILRHYRSEQLQTIDPGRIMGIVVNHRRAKLGDDHLDTLNSELLLALIARDESTHDSREYASDALYEVWRKLSTKFGQSHPLTLSVEREVVVTDCMRAVWVQGGPARRQNELKLGWEMLPSPNDPNKNDRAHSLTLAQWEDVEYVSEEVLQFQEPQLGPLHPETLKSLLWLLRVRSILKSMLMNSPESGIHIDVKKVWDDLRDRLHNSNVVQERPLEAQRMEELALELAEQERRATDAALPRSGENTSS